MNLLSQIETRKLTDEKIKTIFSKCVFDKRH